jgi:hypothetical protein
MYLWNVGRQLFYTAEGQPLVSVLSQMNPVEILIAYLVKI